METRGQEIANQTSASDCMIIFPFPMTLGNGSVLDEVLGKWIAGTLISPFPMAVQELTVQEHGINYISFSDNG